MNMKANRTMRSGLIVGLVFGLSSLFLAGCGESESVATEADSVTMSDAWVKAAPMKDMMTGGFGVLKNSSDADITIKSISAADVAAMGEQHETGMDDSGKMTMKPVAGGHVIPAGGELVLEPGGYHFMFMNLKKDLVAGETVALLITFNDGSTMTVDALVKDFTGANEEYQEN